jgi:hypothetical protein
VRNISTIIKACEIKGGLQTSVDQLDLVVLRNARTNCKAYPKPPKMLENLLCGDVAF